MKCNFVQYHLTKAFTQLGSSVGRHPLIYCVVPIVVTALLTIGFYRLRLTNDLEYLFVPINGRALREREAVESLFPPDSAGSDMMSITRLQDLAMILMEPKDKGSVLREELLEEAENIDCMVRNISVSWGNRTLTLADVCKKTISGECQFNDVLSLRGKIKDVRKKEIYLKYPIHLDKISQRVLIFVVGLGGVTVDGNDVIRDAKAIRLLYALDHSTVEKDKMSSKWEKSFLESVGRINSDHFTISRASGLSMNEETSKVTELSLPLIFITAPIMVVFAIATCLTRDCITSKPWVAVAGSISPVLGWLAAFGFLLLFGFQYIDINVAIPFLLMGIGLDDAFVMLAAWRRTDPNNTVVERMSRTYSEAAVSITITSFTNILSMCVGLGSEYRLLRIYCTYAALSILFSYISQITFFGGALALSGIREHKGLHSVVCIAVEKETNSSFAFLRPLYSGCTNKGKQRTAEEDISWISSFGQFIIRRMVTTGGKVTVMGFYLLYLLSSTYSFTHINEEFDYRAVTPYNSYLADFITMHFKYFTGYGNFIHLVVNETLDYSLEDVQENIYKLIQNFSNNENMAGEEFSYSWLNYYQQSMTDQRLWLSYYGYNFSNPDDFVTGLSNVFLNFHNAKLFRQHVKFNHNETKITSSRFILLSKDVTSADKEKKILSMLWKKADSSLYRVYVHDFWFPYYNSLIEIIPSFINTIVTAIGIVTAVFVIIIPNLFTSFCIFITAVSIQCGVIGYMFLWNVSLNPISLLCVMMSVGLSVDYASHVSYAYLSCPESSPNAKTIYALNKAGYPIIQGCISTFLGASVLYFGHFKSLIMFFKVMTLVMAIALFHGIFVIPMSMNILESLYMKCISHSKQHHSENYENKHINRTLIIHK